MKVLVTGASGYLGSRISCYLSKQAGYKVVYGTRSPNNTAPAWLSGAEVRHIDWSDYSNLGEVVSGIDGIVHLAGMNAQDCTSDPTAALEANGMTTAILLQAAISKKVRRFIYFSTAHVYGSPLVGKLAEESCPLNLHPYATSHRAGEDVVLAARQRGEIEGIVIRASNAFGTPVNIDANCWGLLVNDLCRQAILDRKLVLHSSGMQKRDFVTLHDVECALLHLMNISDKQVGNAIFNLGGAWAPRIIDMAKLVQERCRKTLGFTPEISFQSVKQDEADQSLEYCIDKLINTGFKLSGKPEMEIDATLLFCKKNIGFLA